MKQRAETAKRLGLIGLLFAVAACSGAAATDADATAQADADALALQFADVPGADAHDAVDSATIDAATTDAAQTDDAAPVDADAQAVDEAADEVAGTDAVAAEVVEDTADVSPDVADAGCSAASCPASDAPCSIAICLADGTCGLTAASDGTVCNDGNACTNGDSCQAGACLGTAIVCDDGNSCTIDDCKPNVGCVTSFEFAPCDDGNGCTNNDQCVSGVCTAGSPTVCTSSDPCQPTGSCAPSTGLCTFGALADGTSCGANQVCVTGTCSVADAMPANAFAWFATADCPPGWDLDADSVGRTVVASDGSNVGQMDGTPLAPGEDRVHSHNVTGSIGTGSVSFVGIVGCCNSGLSSAGTWDVSGSALPASSGVPYVQLRACKKTTGGAWGNPPDSLLAFVSGSSCPASWNASTATALRFIVGTPVGGSNGASFGGSWGASHSHSVNADVILASHGIALASGCCGGGYAAAGTVGFAANSDASVSSFPSLARLACAPAVASTPAGPIPSGLVGYFASDACPSGWSDATAVQGRLIVGAAGSSGVGVQVGNPLSDKEDRTHTHSVLLSIQPPGKSIAGGNGGNGQAADGTASQASGSSSSATSGMPFVQWRACQKD